MPLTRAQLKRRNERIKSELRRNAGQVEAEPTVGFSLDQTAEIKIEPRVSIDEYFLDFRKFVEEVLLYGSGSIIHDSVYIEPFTDERAIRERDKMKRHIYGFSPIIIDEAADLTEYTYRGLEAVRDESIKYIYYERPKSLRERERAHWTSLNARGKKWMKR